MSDLKFSQRHGQKWMKTFQRQNLRIFSQRGGKEWSATGHTASELSSHWMGKKIMRLPYIRYFSKVGSLTTVNIINPSSNFQEMESNELCKIRLQWNKSTHISNFSRSFIHGSIFLLGNKLNFNNKIHYWVTIIYENKITKEPVCPCAQS